MVGWAFAILLFVVWISLLQFFRQRQNSRETEHRLQARSRIRRRAREASPDDRNRGGLASDQGVDGAERERFGLTVESGTVVIVSPGAGENVSVLASSTVVAFAECLRTYWAVANPDTASVVRWLPVETQHRIVRDLRTLMARKDEPAFAEGDFFWPAKLQFDDDDICEPEDPFKTGMLES